MTAAHNKVKRPDRRVVRTRKAIMQAFDTLASNGDIDKITVSAIAREADIDRKTFYLHYKSIEDLCNYKTEELIERVLSTLNAEGANKDHLERVHIVLTEINSILASNIPFYSNVASHLSTDQVLEHLMRASESAMIGAGMDPSLHDNQQLYMMLQFFVAGTIFLYSSWLRSDRSQPLEDISNAIEEAIGTLYAQEMNTKACKQ